MRFSIIIILFLQLNLLFSIDTNNTIKNEAAFKIGEELNFKFYYNSLLTGDVLAGYANSVVEQYSLSDNYYKINIDAETRKAYSIFKVEDYYTSYINKSTLLPSYFKKRIREGRYTASRDVKFYQDSLYANYIDNKKETTTIVEIPYGVHDLLSSLFYLRSINFDTVKVGDTYNLSFFLDGEVFDTELKFIGYETIETELGEVDCMKFKPRVLKGNVFNEEEPLTVWVSNDNNKLPIKAESEIRVGSVKIVLVDFDNLKFKSKAIKRD